MNSPQQNDEPREQFHDPEETVELTEYKEDEEFDDINIDDTAIYEESQILSKTLPGNQASFDEEPTDPSRYRKIATTLIILCLINIVVYVKLLADIMLVTDWEKEVGGTGMGR